MATILVEILGNAKQFKGELDKAVASTEKANGGFAKMGKAAGVAGLAIGGGLAFGLVKSVEAADNMQQSTARMNAAFVAVHVPVKAFAGAIEDAEGKSRKLGFTNESVKGSLGSLIIATHNGKKAISDLAVAEDIARFKHISLEAATKTLTMAMSGSQRAVKQLGISVQKSTEASDAATVAHKRQLDALKAQFPATAKQTAAEHALYLKQKDAIDANYDLAKAQAKVRDGHVTAAKVIATVTEKLHGQADAYSKTAAGGMAAFHAQLEDVAEKLGAVLLPALASVATALADGAAFFSKHTTLAKALVVAIGALAGVLVTVSVATKLYAAGQAIVAGATGVWTAAQWLLNAALDANPIGIVVIAIAALVAGVIVAYKESGTFRQIVGDAFDAVKTAAQAVLDFFTSAWAAVGGLITAPFDAIVGIAKDAFGVASSIFGAFKSAKQWIMDNWPIIATIISGPFAPLVALATNAFGIRDKLTGAFQDVKNWLVDKWGDIKGLVTGPFDAIVAAAKDAFGVGPAISGAFKDAKQWVIDHWPEIATIISGPFAPLVALATNAFGIRSATQTALGDVIGFFKELPGKILSALGDVSKILYNAGASIIQGLISGMGSELGHLKNFAGGIASDLTSWKGPIEYDRVLLVPQGQAIMQGLQQGMKSGLGDLHNFTSSIAPSISANVAAAPAGAPVAGGAGGGTTINVTVNAGWIANDQDIAERLKNILIRQGRNTTGGALGRFA